MPVDESGNRCDLQHTQQNERHRSVGPDRMVSHYAQHILSIAPSSEAIRHVGQPVEVQRSCQQSFRNEDEHGDDQSRKHRREHPQHNHVHAPDQRSHQRKPARGLANVFGGNRKAGRDRDAREKRYCREHLSDRSAP